MRRARRQWVSLPRLLGAHEPVEALLGDLLLVVAVLEHGAERPLRRRGVEALDSEHLKRRCLYHWIDYPSPEREVEIVRRRVPGTDVALATGAATAVRRLRDSDVQKPPGIAETIDWVAALELLGVEHLDSGAAERTLGSVLKYRDDQEQIAEQGLDWLVGAEEAR